MTELRKLKPNPKFKGVRTVKLVQLWQKKHKRKSTWAEARAISLEINRRCAIERCKNPLGFNEPIP